MRFMSSVKMPMLSSLIRHQPLRDHFPVRALCGDFSVCEGQDVTGLVLQLCAVGERAGHQQFNHHVLPSETAADWFIADVGDYLEGVGDRRTNCDSPPKKSSV